MPGRGGSSKSLRINGRRFALPGDLNPTVSTGGNRVSEVEDNGDGSRFPLIDDRGASIRGMVCRILTEKGDLEALQNFSGMGLITFVYTAPDVTWSGSGYIVATEEGIKEEQRTGRTESFDILAEGSIKRG